MSSSQIQSFLNSKVTTCDTNGSQTSEYGGGTRAQWAQARYGQNKFTCLKDYQENGKSAAQIIYDVSQQYKINPQVMIVLLQKEQGLVTDTWPLNIQYRSATGYGCPDTAPCDSQYYGLTNQLGWAAKMFRAIMNASPTWYTPYILGNNYIQYNPTASCGGTVIAIQNRSTQALYNYTPYQPNPAALAAPMGSTVTCGAYGNLNFYRYYVSWFGSTSFNGVSDEKNAVWRLYNPKTDSHMFSSDYREVNTYILSGWKSDGVVSHYSTTGTVSIHRLYNPISKYHILSSSQEASLLKSRGWVDDGELFKADNSGKPVWRMSKNGHFFITSDTNELSQYSKVGWNIDGILYYESSEFEKPTWRLYSRQSNTHMLTSDADELTTYLKAGWTSDGVVLSGSGGDTLPVYRLWNGRSHFITADESEKNAYVRAGWINDGVIFRTNNIINVYQLQNTSSGSYKSTASLGYLYESINAGWNINGTFKASRSSGVPVYELKNNTSGSYLYTASSQERTAYQQSGWNLNGLAFYAAPNGIGISRLYSPSLAKHTITQNETEKQSLMSTGWINDGVVFNSYR